MSDWEIVPDNIQAQSQPQPQSDWEMVNETPPESTWESVKSAPGRVWQDLRNAFNQVYNNIPGYIQKSKTEVPGLFSSLSNNPSHALGQLTAGLAEGGKNFFNTPHDIANYLTTRLHLFPEDWNKKIQMGRMPDEETQQAINATFGQPTQTGENLLRGIGRNATDIAGTTGLAKLFNPLKLTSKGIANSVTDELSSQISKHNAMYNDLWNKAEKKGFNQVPYNPTELMNNLSIIEKYTTPKQNQSLIDFMKNPTLPNAQRAQSDAGNIKRILEEKSRTTPLLNEENQLHKALADTEKHIEGNMFTNQAGEKNQSLANRYQNITNSYRKNVVPYRYNPAIQDYLNKDILANELVQSLSRGSFAAKKGWAHPPIKIRNALIPTVKGIGYVGAGKYLMDQIMGNQNSK